MTYPLLAILGIVLSSFIWSWLLRKRGADTDPRLFAVYLSALVGAMLGAKLLYIAAEGWLRLRDPAMDARAVARDWLVGKSVVGALLGGYLAVEIAKKFAGYAKATGDLFAVLAPGGLALGRVGCLIQGCCLGEKCAPHWWARVDAAGVPRWPAVPLEMGFNLLFLAFAIYSVRAGRLRGQVFHVYLMAYGLFRFAHEFARATPKIVGPLSGYAIAALLVFALGAVRYRQRARDAKLASVLEAPTSTLPS